MPAFLRISFVVLLLTLASSAFAVDYAEPAPDNDTDWSGAGVFAPVGGDGGTHLGGPTTTACTARRSKQQGCRTCVAALDERTGQWKGYSICGYVEWSAGCSCNHNGTDACETPGACTYFFD